MTFPPLSDDTASSPLIDAAASARTFVERLWETQSAAEPRGAVSRILGFSPLARESRPWFAGAMGELEVAHRLRALGASGQSWRVLHSVPVGGVADIDHVVIGPAGVFAITLTSSPEAASLSHLRADSDLAALLLGAALGRPVAVETLVVATAAAATAGIRHRQPSDIAVVPVARVVGHLRRLPPVLSVDEVREITRAALRPRTWPVRPTLSARAPGSATVPSTDDLQPWFARVRAAVAAAHRRQLVLASATIVALAGVIFESPAIAQALNG